MKRTVDFYRTQNRKCYIEEFLDSLDAKIVQKIAWTLELIEEFRDELGSSI